MNRTNFSFGNLLRCAIAVFAMLAITHAAEPVLGQDYLNVPVPQPVKVPGKVEVIEFFSFGCPHCNHYEPLVETWAAGLPRDVVFRREHVNFDGRTDWEDFARLAISLRLMGKLDVMARKVFDAVHQQGIDLHDEKTRLDWIAKQGLDRAQFSSMWNNFGMSSQLKNAQQMTTDYHIDGVPEFVVNGKYLVQAQSGDDEGRKMFATINQLVARERNKAPKK